MRAALMRAAAVFAGALCLHAAAVADEVERGRRLLAQYQCGSCHAIPGVEGDGRVAVTLAKFGARSYIAGRWPNSDANLVRWIVDPPAMVPGTLMPSMGVTEDDARAIAAYLKGLQ